MAQRSQSGSLARKITRRAARKAPVMRIASAAKILSLVLLVKVLMHPFTIVGTAQRGCMNNVCFHDVVMLYQHPADSYILFIQPIAIPLQKKKQLNKFIIIHFWHKTITSITCIFMFCTVSIVHSAGSKTMG